MNADQQSGDTTVTPYNPALGQVGRLEFWVDTCREMTQMKVGSRQVTELYRQFGCRFCAPTQSQVEEVLRALDSALPLWEKVHPELFYQTLELNYPELVRHF
jgi:hypothetical protein